MPPGPLRGAKPRKESGAVAIMVALYLSTDDAVYRISYRAP